MRMWKALRIFGAFLGILFMAVSLLGVIYPYSRELHCGIYYCDWDTTGPWPFVDGLGEFGNMLFGFFTGFGMLLGAIILEKPILI